MEFLAKDNNEYDKQEYWDDRFETEESFDWFTEYAAFKHLLLDDIKASDKILILGCGNSRLSEDMYKDGFIHITNMDYSPVVIQKMCERHQRSCPAMTWDVMDIFDMTYGPSTYDVVLEKGTLDAFMVHEKDPWNLSENLEFQLHNVLLKISSILKTGGKFISVTFAQPHFRQPLYGKAVLHWSLTVQSFYKGFHYFYYQMTKGGTLCDSDRQAEIDREKLKEDKKSGRYRPPQTIFMEDNEEDFLFSINV